MLVFFFFLYFLLLQLRKRYSLGVTGSKGGFCFLTVRGSGLFELLGCLSIYWQQGALIESEMGREKISTIGNYKFCER